MCTDVLIKISAINNCHFCYIFNEFASTKGLMSIEKLAIYIMYEKFAKTFGGYFVNFKTMPANRKKG